MVKIGRISAASQGKEMFKRCLALECSSQTNVSRISRPMPHPLHWVGKQSGCSHNSGFNVQSKFCTFCQHICSHCCITVYTVENKLAANNAQFLSLVFNTKIYLLHTWLCRTEPFCAIKVVLHRTPFSFF